MGYVPEWYTLIVAAKYLGVAPWDLNNQHPIWQTWAMWAKAAEQNAHKQLNKPKKGKKR